MTRDPTRLWILSDLPQDCPENAWDPAAHAPAGGFDVAVIAGDVHMPLMRALDWLGERLPRSEIPAATEAASTGAATPSAQSTAAGT